MHCTLSCAAVAVTVLTLVPSGRENPVELGRVRWQRDLATALAESRASGKPVFALFQEIPGCATCQRFGTGPLSHPLLVEAIEDLFVPLAIHNNRGGEDAAVLARYGEPAWNNPVVRFLDADGRDVIERQDRVWSSGGVARRTVEALRAAQRDVPRWLALVAEEADASALETATFRMFCFWQGEARLGALDGVVTTEAGWLDQHEVVEVRYDPARIARALLDEAARQSGCEHVEGAASAARESDRKYYLRRTPLFYLPLTPMQRTKVNAALASGDDPAGWLSPRQLALLELVRGGLEDDSTSLHDAEPPSDTEGLVAYERRLRERLAPRTPQER